MPVTAVSDMAANQLTWVSTIPAFGGLVWYNAGSNWGFSTAGILSARHPTGIKITTGVLDSGSVLSLAKIPRKLHVSH